MKFLLSKNKLHPGVSRFTELCEVIRKEMCQECLSGMNLFNCTNLFNHALVLIFTLSVPSINMYLCKWCD